MKEKIFSLIGGFVLSLAIIMLAIYVFSKPDKIEVPKVEPIDQSKLQSVKDDTSGLNNYGNLPTRVNNSDVGRTNPFDNY